MSGDQDRQLTDPKAAAERAAGLFRGPTHVIRLGYVTEFPTGHTLTVGDRIGGEKRGVRLTAERAALLASLNPMVTDREFDAIQMSLLSWMAEQDLLAVVKSDGALSDLTMILVMRRDVVLEEILDEGYRVHAGDAEPFVISELSGYLIQQIDGRRTVYQMAENVRKQILGTSEGRQAVANNEQEQGRSLDSFLLEDVFELIGLLLKSGAATVEPGV